MPQHYSQCLFKIIFSFYRLCSRLTQMPNLFLPNPEGEMGTRTGLSQRRSKLRPVSCFPAPVPGSKRSMPGQHGKQA